jgi:hypothetical protein
LPEVREMHTGFSIKSFIREYTLVLAEDKMENERADDMSGG